MKILSADQGNFGYSCSRLDYIADDPVLVFDRIEGKWRGLKR